MDRHFVTGSFVSHAGFLGETEYAAVLDSIVIACVDIILVNITGEMLLGKRTTEPQPDYWIIGGRMKPGESLEEAAARNLKRELGIELGTDRFTYLTTLSLVWARRAQEPKDNGSHTISVTMVANVSDGEIAGIRPNEEYSELLWIRPATVRYGTGFHPALVQYAEELLARTK